MQCSTRWSGLGIQYKELKVGNATVSGALFKARIQYKELKALSVLAHLSYMHVEMNPIQRIESEDLHHFLCYCEENPIQRIESLLQTGVARILNLLESNTKN